MHHRSCSTEGRIPDRRGFAARVATLMGGALGLLAVTAAPAAAGVLLGNHCEPSPGATTDLREGK